MTGLRGEAVVADPAPGDGAETRTHTGLRTPGCSGTGLGPDPSAGMDPVPHPPPHTSQAFSRAPASLPGKPPAGIPPGKAPLCLWVSQACGQPQGPGPEPQKHPRSPAHRPLPSQREAARGPASGDGGSRGPSPRGPCSWPHVPRPAAPCVRLPAGLAPPAQRPTACGFQAGDSGGPVPPACLRSLCPASRHSAGIQVRFT